jgi:hypothetical protein
MAHGAPILRPVLRDYGGQVGHSVTLSTEFQAPNPKQISITKIPNEVVWVILKLEFGAYLEF